MRGGLLTWLERVEATCAHAVERTFAVAFPTPIEPVRIARKLVAAFESGSPPGGRGGRRFRVRLHPNDRARIAAELPYLEAQWTAMLARLGERAHQPQRPPEIVVETDRAIATGTIAIAIEALAAPTSLRLRVRRGIVAGGALDLGRPGVVGRDPSCDLVLADPRVSRRHLAIDAARRFRDLGSANGTRHNGVAAVEGTLGLGDVLVLGESELVVEGGP